MLKYTIFTTAAALAVCWWTTVSAVEQPDVVGPEGVFENSVSTIMTEEGVTRDVAEMLVAAQMFSSDNDNPTKEKLDNALRFMDEVQKSTGDLYDKTYDDFLDLYPSWRTYLLSKGKLKDSAFHEYKTLLDRYNNRQQDLIQGLGFLVALQQALLPSNVFVDPDKRINSSADTAAILNGF